MKNRGPLVTIVLPILVVLFGITAMILLAKSRPAPKKQARQSKGALVRIITAAVENRRADIHATGTVQPSRQISIIAQVGGQVTSLSPQCVAGGFIKEGELLFAIDDADYRLAEAQAGAAVARAEAELATARGQAEVARSEWQQFGNKSSAANPLVLHQPQLKTAEANLAAAKATLVKARLDLSRTEVRAPFNCLVLSEDLGLGLTVRAGNPVAKIVGTDQAEVIVPLPMAELPWCVIPRNNKSTGSPATITATIGTRRYHRQGTVLRSLGEIDPKGRMLRLAIGVDDPYRLNADKPKPLDLTMGMFVDVTIHGHPLNKVIALPRKAIRPGSMVWLMDNQQKLRLRPVKVARFTDDEALISKGLNAGDRVVLTTLNGAADGMALRPMNEGEQP